VSRRHAAVLVIGKSDEEISYFERSNPTAANEVRLVLVSNPGMKLGGYAAIANPFIDEAVEDVVGIVHADTVFAPGSLLKFGEKGTSDVVGIVGREAPPGDRYVWSKDEGGPVSTLDSCSIFMPRFRSLRFDHAFDSFHCVVEDLCLFAKFRMHMQVRVPGCVDADHLGNHWTWPKDEKKAWWREWRRYRTMLDDKWAEFAGRYATT
jgi:hypothetical protein